MIENDIFNDFDRGFSKPAGTLGPWQCGLHALTPALFLGIRTKHIASLRFMKPIRKYGIHIKLCLSYSYCNVKEKFPFLVAQCACWHNIKGTSNQNITKIIATMIIRQSRFLKFQWEFQNFFFETKELKISFKQGKY